ncbi:NAD(P)-binding domain-containing protein [Ensifer canadensis]
MTKIAFIGLGNMGGPMAANLVKAGHAVTGFDLSEASLQRCGKDGCFGCRFDHACGARGGMRHHHAAGWRACALCLG